MPRDSVRVVLTVRYFEVANVVTQSVGSLASGAGPSGGVALRGTLWNAEMTQIVGQGVRAIACVTSTCVRLSATVGYRCETLVVHQHEP